MDNLSFGEGNGAMSEWEICCVDFSTTHGAPPRGTELDKLKELAADGWEPFATDAISQGPSVQNWRMWFRRKQSEDD